MVVLAHSAAAGRLMLREGFLILLLAAGLLMSPAHAAVSAGKVLMAVGDTSRLDSGGGRGVLKVGDLVNSGDTLLTGSGSRLQWRTNDGGLFALRPNSEFKVDDYQYDAGSNKGRSFFSLAKGGFRTLSGTIGKRNRDNYKVTTPVVTLGIRGTHYVVQLCLVGSAMAAACNGVAPGLYMGTIVGAVLLGNGAGNLQVNAGQFGYVSSLISPPELLPVSPGMLFDTVLPDGRGGAARRVATGGGGLGPRTGMLPAALLPKFGVSPKDGLVNLSDASLPVSEAEPVVVVEPPVVVVAAPVEPLVADDSVPPPVIDPGINTPAPPPTTPPIDIPGVQFSAFSSGPVGLSATNIESTAVPVPDINSVGSDPDFGVSDLYNVGVSGVSQIDTGEDPNTGIFWGRYINGVFEVPGVDANGNQTPNDPFGNRSLHYVSGTSADFVQLPISGTATYALVGGTTPTDNFGNTGTLGSAFLNADFTNQKVAVALEVNIDSRTWVVDNSSVPLNPSAATFGGSVPVFITNTASGTTGFGEVTGFFAGDQASPGEPTSGAGLSYSLSDSFGSTTGQTSGQTVSGAAALELQ